MIDKILEAMRADRIEPRSSGRWTVERRRITERESETSKWMEKAGKSRYVPPADFTWLWCMTMERMMDNPLGECVMNDFPCELRKHLQFVLRARGRVLVTGLGLGCVVRGLLARGQVESIDLVERSPDVLKLCGDSVADPRVRIHQRDAVGFAKGTDGEWDFAWHDLWNDPERSERGLQAIHAEIMCELHRRERVKVQGAWAMPRWFGRRVPELSI